MTFLLLSKMMLYELYHPLSHIHQMLLLLDHVPLPRVDYILAPLYPSILLVYSPQA